MDLLESLGTEGISLIADVLDACPHNRYQSIWRRLSERTRAVELRKAGFGYGAIGRRVGVGKGQLVNWLTGRYDPLRRHVRPRVGPNLAYGIGAWLGDGTLMWDRKRWKHYTRLYVKDADFAKAFSESLASCLGRQRPLHVSRRKDGRFSVAANNRILHDFLLASKTRPELLKPIIVHHPRDFLAGFWDAEGSIYVAKSSHSIRCFNTRIEIVRLVTCALDRLAFHYTVNSRIREDQFKGPIDGKIYHRKHRVMHTINVRSCCHLKFQQTVDLRIKRKSERLGIIAESIGSKTECCLPPSEVSSASQVGGAAGI